MRLFKKYTCDVLVIGAGIAGISAALEAAGQGRSVILNTGASIFSGSSFYPGTWGLGLIGPADTGDRQDLVDTIRAVGCGMADPVMVETFVNHIHPAIERVRKMGVQLRRAGQGGQKEYVPCFDHKHRDWNGIEFDSAREVFSRQMRELGVHTLPGCPLMELAAVDGHICGAVVLEKGRPVLIGCQALVLATGGYGSLFQYHLCTEDITGLGQALALKAGCSLVNMEFMQMMPGYLSPAFKTIYNEKVFRFTRFQTCGGSPLFPDTPEWRERLELRSTHGPFTSRLLSKEVDLALFRAFAADERGVTAIYSEEIRRRPPEFVKTYFDWLEKAKGLTVDDPIQIGIFAHAANGGIQIRPDASTGVPGLFACGEVTGGMHGADRIGGLSTANGLVFGGIAGRSAALAQGQTRSLEEWEFDCWAFSNIEPALAELQNLMFQNAMIIRSEAGLSTALKRLTEIRAALSRGPAEDAYKIAASRRLEGQLLTAECILQAALTRRESRGSHFRADFPQPDPEQARPLEITYRGSVSLRLKGESD